MARTLSVAVSFSSPGKHPKRANHGRGQQDENEKQERFHKGGAVTARTFCDFGLPEIWGSPTREMIEHQVTGIADNEK